MPTEKKTETITFRVSTEDKAMIKNLAWVHHCSVAYLLTNLSRNEVKRIQASGQKLPTWIHFPDEKTP